MVSNRSASESNKNTAIPTGPESNMLGPAIEGARIGGKDALEALTTTPEVLTSARATIAAPGAI